MKNHSIFLLLFSASMLVFLNTSCKPAPKPVTEDEAYALLNEVILDDTLILHEVYYKFSGLALSDDMKKAFTEEEVEFMENQIANLRVKMVKPNKMVYFHKGYKPGDFAEPVKKDEFFTVHISFPIISPDRKKLLIHMTAGQSGSDDLYVKKNGRWRLVTRFNAWIG